MQIEIDLNLEAYVCLSCDALTTKAIFQMKRKHVFRDKDWHFFSQEPAGPLAFEF